MNKIESKGHSSNNENQNSLLIPELLGLNPSDLKLSLQTSELWKYYMITLGYASGDEFRIEALNLETEKFEEVTYKGEIECLNRYNHCTCRTEGNHIILYGGMGGDRKHLDIVTLNLYEDNQGNYDLHFKSL